MKHLKKINILWRIRLLSLHHIIPSAAIITAAFLLLNVIDFDGVFSPTLYKNSFDAYSAYTKGSNNVTVTIDNLKYTGYNIMKGEKVVSVYYYDLSSNRCMFYKLDMKYDSINDIPKSLSNVTISGRFKEPDGLAKTMMESFSQSIDWNYEGLISVIFPVIMDEREYDPNLYYILYGFIIICIFYNLYLLAINLVLMIAPYLHPAYLKIKPYYKDIPYFDMVDLINDEFEEDILVMAGPMYITNSCFINLGKGEISIMPLEQIALAYEHGELFSFFGIHIRINHTLHLRGLKNISILASKQQSTNVTIITDYIREHYPNIIWGHTKENIKAYKQILATEKATEKAAKEAAKQPKAKKTGTKNEKTDSKKPKTKQKKSVSAEPKQTNPAKQKQKKSVPAKTKTEKSIPAEPKQAKPVPTKKKTEKNIPPKTKQEKSVPAKQKKSSSKK